MPLSDAQWARIETLLPDRTPKRGGRWRDHREVIDAIAFPFPTGTQWVHLPEMYGNWRGVCNRLRRAARPGTTRRADLRGRRDPSRPARPRAGRRYLAQQQDRPTSHSGTDRLRPLIQV
ncbi:transposase [Streptomyces buecherae]|uniref:transposase n=1 Tax=Streptomyces buecherae TaxID=2763006 RepID=UPI00365CB23F